MSAYWSERRDLEYYRVAIEFVRRFGPRARRLLDVGGGVGYGCRYLEWLPELKRTSVELPSSAGCELRGVRVIEADFLKWVPDGDYDVALCLQVLEHVREAKAFAEKLFGCAPVVVLSVPYRWPNGATPAHVQDPVDEQKLRRWTGRDPTAWRIVDRRLVCAYDGASDGRSAPP